MPLKKNIKTHGSSEKRDYIQLGEIKHHFMEEAALSSLGGPRRIHRDLLCLLEEAGARARARARLTDAVVSEGPAESMPEPS